MTADGGGNDASGSGGGGGGGRVALDYGTSTFTGAVHARGDGSPSVNSYYNGAGTVYLKQDAAPRGTVIANNGVRRFENTSRRRGAERSAERRHRSRRAAATWTSVKRSRRSRSAAAANSRSRPEATGCSSRRRRLSPARGRDDIKPEHVQALKGGAVVRGGLYIPFVARDTIANHLSRPMNDNVTRILAAVERGDGAAANELLPLVYQELRKLAAQRLAQEKPGQTLQPTALVHEAYLRLVDVDSIRHFDGRGHFFAAAAEAMRRILVDGARRKRSLKGGGDRRRVDLADVEPAIDPPDGLDVLALDEALVKLEAKDPRKAELVKLRFFAGLNIEEAARALGISPSTADNDWAYARAWLRVEMQGAERAGAET